MICNDLNSLLGFQCMPLDEAGTTALIETPFTFADGAALQVFAQDAGQVVTFFDDGFTVWHLMGRGLKLADGRSAKFLQNIADRHGLKLTEKLELEAACQRQEAPRVFAQFLGALIDVTAWEREQEQADSVTEHLIEEVAIALMKWRPTEELVQGARLKGVTKQSYEVDFLQGNEVVLVVTPHHSSVSSAVRKLLDLQNLPGNEQYKFRVVLEDRKDVKAAQREGMVLSTVAHVTMMQSLLRSGVAAVH